MASLIVPLDPPFIQVDGVFNFRSVGGYFLSSNKTLHVKPNLLFRSGELSGISPTGIQALSTLGVNTIFDLRSKNETDKWKTHTPHLGDVKVVHVPTEQKVDFSNDYLDAFLQKFETDELNAFLDTYQETLTNLGPALESAIRHLIQDPGHPFVVHCTGKVGKDRTGILVAVILLLLGVSETEVAEDYALSEIGLKPVYEMLTTRLAKVEAFRNNPVGAQNMGKSRAETMLAVIKSMQDKYGDAEQYVLAHTSLTRDDIGALRRSVLIEA
ncbi:hypothetical protein P691DRAFT_824264 [Macrolepiota fuliginosa MF-IS2]|uniref:Tyrosine specific protein phosphatases domain-containing protein n=1 Tax=Macrolepiota fuliginosa MF-IS2 TaxID=1400762 RepID=A0A9P5XAT6_9AGAR|nr:hypothetical protein P691DRAFT_824264 [Macrolepiota fuliginosa MF-IS2]